MGPNFIKFIDSVPKDVERHCADSQLRKALTKDENDWQCNRCYMFVKKWNWNNHMALSKCTETNPYLFKAFAAQKFG